MSAFISATFLRLLACSCLSPSSSAVPPPLLVCEKKKNNYRRIIFFSLFLLFSNLHGLFFRLPRPPFFSLFSFLPISLYIFSFLYSLFLFEVQIRSTFEVIILSAALSHLTSITWSYYNLQYFIVSSVNTEAKNAYKYRASCAGFPVKRLCISTASALR